MFRSGIGLKLFGGPLGLPGFGMAIRTPELMSSSSWFVNVLLNTFAIVWYRRGVEYFSSSGYIWSSPGALLLYIYIYIQRERERERERKREREREVTGKLQTNEPIMWTTITDISLV